MPRHRHDPSKNLVGFLVGDVAYAVRIETVREIVNPLPVSPLPRMPGEVVGVADYRGVVVPVLDLRARFGLPHASSRRTKWIVVDVSRRDVGAPLPPATAPGTRGAALVVDAVTDVFGTSGKPIRPSPTLGDGDDVRGIEGVVEAGGRLVFVLDATAFAVLAEQALAHPGAVPSALPSPAVESGKRTSP